MEFGRHHGSVFGCFVESTGSSTSRSSNVGVGSERILDLALQEEGDEKMVGKRSARVTTTTTTAAAAAAAVTVHYSTCSVSMSCLRTRLRRQSHCRHWPVALRALDNNNKRRKTTRQGSDKRQLIHCQQLRVRFHIIDNTRI